MQCTNCQQDLANQAQPCPNCGINQNAGAPTAQMPQPMVASKKKADLTIGTFFSLKVSPAEMDVQLANYNSPKFPTFHHNSVLFLGMAAAGDLIAIVTGFLTYSAFIDLAILAGLAFLVFRGYKWAIIVAMVIWTIERGFQLFGGKPGPAVVGWVIPMIQFYKAYLVEVARKKASVVPAPSAQPLS